MQTSALPLGYAAGRGKRAEGVGMKEGFRFIPWSLRPQRVSKRETGFEPATSTLARSHSTAELLPRERCEILQIRALLSSRPKKRGPGQVV